MRPRFLAAAAIVAVAVPVMTPASSATASPVAELVGVGSDTTQDVIGALGDAYNDDIVANPTGDSVVNITATGGPHTAPGDLTCTEGVSYEANTQPNGSSGGITALSETDPLESCLDFARSSRSRRSTDPSFLSFHAFAKDAVTWASFSGGNAPADLTQQQLQLIYTCQVSDWSQVGGSPGTIVRYLPPSTSGTRSFFSTGVLGGVTIPATCPVTIVGENDGTQVAATDRPNAVLPYSVANWNAQANGASTDVRGGTVLGSIAGVAPTTANIADASFPAIRHVYNVMRTDTLPIEQLKLTQLFGPAGYLCTSASAQEIITTFGFVLEDAADCGRDLG
jgi:ABC-type phosphate transport system substrate-binding protein